MIRNNGLLAKLVEGTVPAEEAVPDCLLCHAETYQADDLLVSARSVRATGGDNCLRCHERMQHPEADVHTLVGLACVSCHTAMDHDIEAIFIDVGNTLRVLVEDEPYQAQARQQIATLVGAEEYPESFCERLNKRYKVYRKWAFETLIEASEKELWTRWLLPDCPPDKIAPLSGELTFLYPDHGPPVRAA